ncbi:MAG: ABC transporter permease [Bacteroides sp.]|nr:ABC transporter permease [Bacteroides sp.]MCM1550475.1 ABC transporter permease [Clostridium sp.]
MEINQLLALLWQGALESLYMVLMSTAVAYLAGIPLGVLLFVTAPNGICQCRPVNLILGIIVNLTRSIPFIILLIAILPFTRLVVGTTIGTNATVVPLVVAAIPFVARMVESSLKEVDQGVIEAAQAMGSGPFQIIRKVLLPEATPSLLVGCTITFTTLLGYSAMAGFTGGGGLGAIAINYGYYRYQANIMWVTVFVLVVIVQIFQELGMFIVNKTDKRIRN